MLRLAWWASRAVVRPAAWLYLEVEAEVRHLRPRHRRYNHGRRMATDPDYRRLAEWEQDVMRRRQSEAADPAARG